MQVYLGQTGDKKYLVEMERLGWGRMWNPATPKRNYAGEPCAMDNGAFAAWQQGRSFPTDAFIKRLDKAQVSPPDWLVVPDIVGDGERSLDFSLSWLDRLPRWDKYLAVQDGMTVEMVEPSLHHFNGVFLGGTDRFKGEAKLWVNLAHKHNKPLHYGRANTASRMIWAKEAGADSIDSSFPLWTRRRMALFVKWYEEITATNRTQSWLLGLCEPTP